MKYMIGVLALVALQVCTANGQTACVCGRNYLPVCGTDGVTYSNECLLECEARLRNEGLSKASEGPCATSGVQTACICTDDLNEVCGSDGKTYTNNCSLNCATSNDNTLSVKHFGKCETVQVVDLPTLPCPCLDWDFDPVCGSDGQTYVNSCFFKCAAKNYNTLSIKHHGRCQTVQVDLPVQPPCPCFSREYNPVCGSNGKTYANPCLLNCATVYDNTLSIKHHGSCQTVHEVDLPVQPPCLCISKKYIPVCGSNGKTYENLCIFNCATVHDNTLSIKHTGACNMVQVDSTPAPCTCARNLKPVCGSDGKSYNNECLLNCAKGNNNTLSISHHGQCGPVNIVD